MVLRHGILVFWPSSSVPGGHHRQTAKGRFRLEEVAVLLLFLAMYLNVKAVSANAGNGLIDIGLCMGSVGCAIVTDPIATLAAERPHGVFLRARAALVTEVSKLNYWHVESTPFF